jgi:hypothetical protein
MNTWNVFFLFPGRVCFGFLGHWDPNRQRTYRVKILSLFGTIHVDTEFELLVSILFLNSFSGGDARSSLASMCSARIAVCLGKVVPVA